MTTTAAFVVATERDGHEWFAPTGHCRGPWDPDACHAGPPAGLLARAASRSAAADTTCRCSRAGSRCATRPNTDLTVLLHRPPSGEWFGVESVSRREPSGVGMSDSLLFDDQGPVGRALQTLLIRRR